MCTTVVRFDPGAAWPVLVAFVRDEDRERETDPPGFWWPGQPDAFGGRDARAGGTWLAVDVASGTIAFVQNQIGPHVTYPDATDPPSRGGLPLVALHGVGRDLVSIERLERYQPFHVVALHSAEARWWQWSGSELSLVDLQQGMHLIASRGIDLPGERERRATQLARFANVDAPEPEPDLDSTTAWSEWLELLDGRAAQPDDLGGMVVHSVSERPGFGTVGATLVGIAADGRVRFDVNATTTLAPEAWRQVQVANVGAGAR